MDCIHNFTGNRNRMLSSVLQGRGNEDVKKNNMLEILICLFCIVFLFYIMVILPILMLFCDTPIMAHAEDNPYGTPFQAESTAYCHGEITASGNPVREGIVAARKEWIGQTAILYVDDAGKIGELIGIYEILDTGGDERIKNGDCIDIYMQDRNKCLEWGRKKIWVQIVDAKG